MCWVVGAGGEGGVPRVGSAGALAQPPADGAAEEVATRSVLVSWVDPNLSAEGLKQYFSVRPAAAWPLHPGQLLCALAVLLAPCSVATCFS